VDYLFGHPHIALYCCGLFMYCYNCAFFCTFICISATHNAKRPKSVPIIQSGTLTFRVFVTLCVAYSVTRTWQPPNSYTIRWRRSSSWYRLVCLEYVNRRHISSRKSEKNGLTKTVFSINGTCSHNPLQCYAVALKRRMQNARQLYAFRCIII